MILPIEFLSGADAEMQRAFNQFEDYQEGFGVEFLTAVEACLSRIAVFPEIAPVYFETVRRQVMQGFPYGILYEPHPTRIFLQTILPSNSHGAASVASSNRFTASTPA